ncbi:MAG: hypothetical protein DME01_14250 [Candidatus Rokuibacteriota bacterium]|nr:MAG: hypothetical protein DME01_14250 [Candidatus Rokubacteria bacterium]
MAEDCRAIVGSVAREIANAEDTGEATSVAAVTTGEWAPEMAAQRHTARSQLLWMVDRARHAAQNERGDDARWWRERAICALWNLN